MLISVSLVLAFMAVTLTGCGSGKKSVSTSACPTVNSAQGLIAFYPKLGTPNRLSSYISCGTMAKFQRLENVEFAQCPSATEIAALQTQIAKSCGSGASVVNAEVVTKKTPKSNSANSGSNGTPSVRGAVVPVEKPAGPVEEPAAPVATPVVVVSEPSGIVEPEQEVEQVVVIREPTKVVTVEEEKTADDAAEESLGVSTDNE